MEKEVISILKEIQKDLHAIALAMQVKDEERKKFNSNLSKVYRSMFPQENPRNSQEDLLDTGNRNHEE